MYNKTVIKIVIYIFQSVAK